MSGDIYDDRPENGTDAMQFGDQTLPPALVGTSLAEPVIDEVASTLTPLVERAAVACDSLRDAVARAGPTEATLRATLTQITGLLERADRLVPDLEARTMSLAIDADESAPNAADSFRAMIDTAVENLGTRCQMQLDLVRTEIDGLSTEIGSRLDALTARVEKIASRTPTTSPDAAINPTPTAEATTGASFEPAMAESLAVWETQVGELLRLFREKAEQAMANVDEIGRRQAEALDALCARAERILTSPGRDAGTIAQVLDEVVHTIEPWRGLLIEGKCSPEISPVIGAIVDRVRAEVQGDIGRLGATVDEVVALTSRLAEASPFGGSAYDASEPDVERPTPSKPKAARPVTAARSSAASIKSKSAPVKGKSKR